MVEGKAKSRHRQRRGPLTEEERIRRRVEKRIKERQEFKVHLVIFFMVNLLLFTIWFLSSGPGSFPWPLIPFFGWGIGIVAHYMEYNHKYGAGAERREQEIQRELAKARRQGRLADAYDLDAFDEKRKNEDLIQGRVRLSEDGEFTESFVAELIDFEDPNRDRDY